MPQRNTAWVVALALLSAAGCTPDVAKLIEMRGEIGADQAVETQTELLGHLGAGPEPKEDPDKITRRGVWRVEAMRTLAWLDRTFELPTRSPQLHEHTVKFLLDEYHQPGSASARQAVRAWAVWALGRLGQDQPVGVLLDICEENDLADDPDYRICLAALDALVPRVEALQADPAAKRRMLLKLAAMTADCRSGRLDGAEAKQLATRLEFFRRKLMGYPAVVDLLTQTDRRLEHQPLAEILDWNYKRCKLDEHRAPETSGLWQTNVEALVGLAWHEQPEIRRRSRILLAEFAPAALVGALADRFAGPTPPLDEDFVQAVNLLEPLDADPPDAWPRRRSALLGDLFDRIDPAPPAIREVVYARLLAVDPDALAGGLLGRNARAVGEDQALALQHLRYLSHVRDKLGARPLSEAIAVFVDRPSAPIRAQAAGMLLPDQALLLASRASRHVDDLPDQAPPAAEALLDAYLAALDVAEEQFDRGLADPALRSQIASHPLQLLDAALQRDEFDMRTKAVEFCARRDAALAVDLLAGDLRRRLRRDRPVKPRDVVLLGDLLQPRLDALAAATRDRAVTALADTIHPDQAERSLLAVRYLLEIGRAEVIDPRRKLPPAARMLIEMHTRAGAGGREEARR